MAGTTYQTVNFHFMVTFDFDPTGSSVDVAFQSVTGLDSTMETETLKEGGENRFTHVLPVRRKFGPLVLKRGLLGPDQSQLTTRLKQAFENDVFTPFQVVTIHLLDESHNSMMYWAVNNVWPLSWKISELNSLQGEVLIETLELNYNVLLFNSH
jgi:phage tail-like protein